jgi:hypothetical protein
MNRHVRLVAISLAGLALSGGILAAAEPPYALLTASGDIKLNGKPLPTVGAPNWPLDLGDELITGTASAVVTFSDGMRITLASDTKVVLKKCNHCVVQFFQGVLDFDKPAGSKADICALGRPVKPVPDSRGSVTIVLPDKVIVRFASEEKVLASGKCPCDLGAPWGITGMSTPAKVAIIGGVAAAAATAGIIVSRPPGSTTTP